VAIDKKWRRVISCEEFAGKPTDSAPQLLPPSLEVEQP